MTQARHAARIRLEELGFGGTEVAAVVEVLVSELLTNALTHTGGFRGLDLRVDGDQIRAGVVDCEPDDYPKIVTEPSGDPLEALMQESGRGVLLFEGLATTWGWTVFPRNACKEVWVYVGINVRSGIDD